MSRAANIFPKGGLKAKLYTFGFALIGYSVLVLSLNNRNTDTTKIRAVTSTLNSSPSQAAANSTLRANQTKMHTNLSSVLLSSDYQSHVEEKYLLYFTHSGFSNQVLGLQRAAQIAYASKRTLVLPPVLPHHTFNRDFLKYPKFEAEFGAQCDKEHWIHYYLKLAKELVDFPSFKALFNFDSISKKTNGLKVIDMQEFSRLENVNATDFSKWCLDIHEEDSTCNYPKSPSIYFEVLDALEEKCRETQIAALRSGFQIRAPPNTTKIANFNEINSYFDQIELSNDMLKLLHSIYNKLPQNYNGAHMRINDRAVCESKDTCEETCNEEETKSAFVDFIKDIDSTKNTSHVLLGYGNEVVVKCFEYFAKEKYNITTVYDTVENDPHLLQMLEGIRSEKDTVYLLLDQILIGLAGNLNMKVNFGRKFSSTYQGEIKKWHNRRHDILASMKSSDIRRAISNNTHPIHESSAKNNTGVEAKNTTVEEGLGSEQGTNRNKISLVFVTASSANHMLALLLDNLPSIEKWVLNTTTSTFLPTLEGQSAPTKADLSVRVIHYNLDPVEKRALKKNQANIQKLQNKFPYVELREFDYAAYPSYFNIEIATGEYAFKPVIVEEVARELQNMDADNSTFGTMPNKGYGSYAQSYLYFLDAGVKIEDGGRPFQKDFQIAKKQGIYTPSSQGPLKRWTVQGTADYLGLDHEIYDSPETRIGSGGIVLLDLKNQTIYDSVIKPWMTCARVKECIAPKGSNRTNHRQDQSALSVILNKNNIDISDNTYSITRGRQ